MRIVLACICAVVLMASAYIRDAFAADTAFQAWLQSLWPQAQALGVSLPLPVGERVG